MATAGDTGGDAEEAIVELRYRPSSFLFPRGVIGALGIVYVIVLLALDPRPSAVVIMLGLNMVLLLAGPLLSYISARRHPVAVRMGPQGIEWPVMRMEMSWSSVAGYQPTLGDRDGPREWLNFDPICPDTSSELLMSPWPPEPPSRRPRTPSRPAVSLGKVTTRHRVLTFPKAGCYEPGQRPHPRRQV